MQAMPDNRQQSFDEIYGAPENFLEIEVRFSPRLSRTLALGERMGNELFFADQRNNTN